MTVDPVVELHREAIALSVDGQAVVDAEVVDVIAGRPEVTGMAPGSVTRRP